MGMEASRTATKEQQENFFDFFHWRETEDVPNQILHALARWALLYEMPFPYMAVREEMLPQESIRFFSLDRSYIAALLDGAMSLGRSFDIDYRHDAEIMERVMDATFCESSNIRPRLQKKKVPGRDGAVNALSGRVTGFLLRSELVSGWRGLEFQAFPKGDEQEPLRALRLETLGTEVLLGLYMGEIHKLEIAQPPEGMHFGFSRKKGAKDIFEKRVRSLTDGKLLEGESALAQVVLRDSRHRVVNLAATMTNVQKVLGKGEINSALVALEMIQNPYTGEVAEGELGN